MARLLTLDKGYLFVPVYGPASAGDLSQYTVEIALIADTGIEPVSGDFHAAQWMSPDGIKPKEAALLIGPGGGTIYAAGSYMAFARITAGTEVRVLEAGRVRIGI